MRSFILLLLAVTAVVTTNAQVTQSWGDYTLISPQNSTTSTLLDKNKAAYKTWTLTGQTAYSTYILPNGVLLRTVKPATTPSFSGGGMAGRVQKTAWDGTILWDYTYSTTAYCSHHDICALPNGNVLLIAYEIKTAAEVAAAGCSSSAHLMWPDKIVEIQPTGTTTGTVVWEWHTWDHLVQEFDATKANYGVVANNPQLLNLNYKNTATTKDWQHANGIDYNAELDQIIFSSHNLNEMYIIDHSTTTAQAATHTGGRYGKGGDFLYRWGNPAAYNGTGTTNFNVLHDAHFVSKDCPLGGSIAAFNNNGTTAASTADIATIPRNVDGSYNLTGGAMTPATYTKRTVSNGKTSNMGSAQQLPNGNTLFCIALSGLVHEKDSLGTTTLWTYTATGSVSQAFRYSHCYIKGPPTVTTATTTAAICEGQTAQLTSTPANGLAYTYNWTANGASAGTSQNLSVTPTATTTYRLIVTAGVCKDTADITITVNPLPAMPTITNMGGILTSSATTGNQWFMNGAPIAGATDVTYTPTASGDYAVQTTDANACVSMVSAATTIVYVATSSVATAHTLNIFPNPANNHITLQGSAVTATDYTVTIFDVLGRVQLTANNTNIIDLTYLTTGAYYIKVSNAAGSTVGTLIKK